MLETAKRNGSRGRAFLWPCVVGGCVLIIVYQQYRLTEYGIRLAFAQEQVAVFHEMVTLSRTANTFNREANLEYVRQYYGSGTKQARGSQLDRLAESCRKFAIDEIEWIGRDAER